MTQDFRGKLEPAGAIVFGDGVNCTDGMPCFLFRSQFSRGMKLGSQCRRVWRMKGPARAIAETPNLAGVMPLFRQR